MLTSVMKNQVATIFYWLHVCGRSYVRLILTLNSHCNLLLFVHCASHYHSHTSNNNVASTIYDTILFIQFRPNYIMRELNPKGKSSIPRINRSAKNNGVCLMTKFCFPTIFVRFDSIFFISHVVFVGRYCR